MLKFLLLALLGYETLVVLGITLIVTLTIRKPIFWLIQFVNAQLLPVGAVVCLWPTLAHLSWVFWNDDDGAVGSTWWQRYVWLAWRNPVDNWKHVKWTQAPYNLSYKTWFWKLPVLGLKQFYYKVGWMSNTYAAMSLGTGRGY